MVTPRRSEAINKRDKRNSSESEIKFLIAVTVTVNCHSLGNVPSLLGTGKLPVTVPLVSQSSRVTGWAAA